jgi:DNA-binding CsgD family transcriptional regulator
VGSLALISGGLASGKTELLHRFQRIARDDGALVLTAVGSRTERALQAGVIDQLFHGAGLPPEVADRVSRLIAPSAMGPDDHGPDVRTIQHTSARAVHQICGVLLELSRQRPVVVCVDDVQFADSSSLHLILYLRRRMASARVLVVLSEWEQPQSTLPLFHAEVTRRPHLRLRLAPLSEAEIAELIAERVDVATSARLASAWHAASGGNPMLVRAMLDDLTVGHAAGSDLAGPAFGRAVLACLHRGEPSLLEIARAVAALGPGHDSWLIGRLADTTAQAAEQAIQILTSAGLVADGQFRHPVAAAAVLASTPGTERSRLHHRAAELLYQRGVAGRVVAGHLVAADRAPQRWAVPVLQVAAEQALMADAVGDAVRYLELALTSADDEQRLGITKVLVRALWRVNPSAASAHIEPLRQAMWAGLLRDRDAVTLVRHAMWNADETTAERALGVINAAPGMLDAQSAAELRIICRWFHGLGPATAVAEAVPAGDHDPWVAAASALGTFWTPEFGAADCGKARASAEHILRSSRPGDTAPEVVATALLILAYGGQAERAAWWCDRLASEAARSGVVTWQAVIEVVSADIALRRGELMTAVARAEQALTLLPHQSWGVSIGYPLAVLLKANITLGRNRTVEDLMRERVPEGMFDTVYGLRYLHARGHGNLATDRVLAAISDFQNCGERMRSWGVDLPVLVPWRTDLAEANLRLGRPNVARELVAEQMALPGTDRCIDGVALRVLAAASEPAQRAPLLLDAVRLLRETGDRMALARAMADLAVELERLGEHELAGELARGAAEETSAIILGPAGDWVPDARHGEPADAVERGHPSVLSDSERRVAELAAGGHTNREISMRLHITVSTVEQHLTRVYRKLGVKSRADLPRSLSRRPALRGGPVTSTPS